MANLLITGASGGIGQHLCRHLSTQHVIVPISRSASDTSLFAPCDLVTQVPEVRDSADASTVQESAAREIDWIIHLATTYRIEDDLAMLDNLIKFAREHDIENFVYVSSWVVHFPRRPIGASYIEMKRRCEQRLLESGITNPRIIRPSVVLGANLSWTRILRKLSTWSWLIPSRCSRSFVTIDQLCRSIEAVIAGDTRSAVVTSLGTRQPLSEKAREHQVSQSKWMTQVVLGLLILIASIVTLAPTPARVPIVGAIAGCLFALAMLRLMLPSVLGSTSDYFAGFVDRHFEPETEQDVIALCHRDNGNIRIRGYDNARLYFQNPHSERHTTVCLRRFNRVLEIDRQRNLVSVQSGAHFGDLLPLLDSMDLWLDNYPNYHFISVGACIATAVHGSNLDKPFLADLVQSIRYYDRVADQVFEVQRQDAQFADLIFNQNCPQRRIILSAQLQICPRQYYELNSERQPVESLSFDDETAFTGQTQHYEVRVNTPRSRDAILQSYQQVGVDPAEAAPSRDKQLLPIKADPIGRKWNLLQRNAFFSSLTSVGSRFFINYEWFFTPEEFARFWEDISSDRSRYRLYKLLVRYNRRQPDLNTPYHGTVSIDITILNTQSMLTMAAELYQRYRPLEHLGKYSIERYINRSNEHQTVAERSGTTGIRSPQIVAD